MRLKIVCLKTVVFILVLCLYMITPVLFAMAVTYLVPETVTSWVITAFFCLVLHHYLKIKIAELKGFLYRKIKDKETEKADF